MYNVFNQNDPIAYRLEPLIDPSFEQVKPMSLLSSISTSSGGVSSGSGGSGSSGGGNGGGVGTGPSLPTVLKDFGTGVLVSAHITAY